MSDWRRFAACRDADPNLFFPENSGIKGKPIDYGPALAICAVCPAVAACRDEHIKEETGVWGGLTPNQRHKLATRRRPVLGCANCGTGVPRGPRSVTSVAWCGAAECQAEAARVARERRNAAAVRRRGRVA